MNQITENGGPHARTDRAVATGLAVAGALGLAWLAGMVYVIAAWSTAG